MQFPLKQLIALSDSLGLALKHLEHSDAITHDEFNAIAERKRDLDRSINAVITAQQVDVTS
jgi:hypothetical protein